MEHWESASSTSQGVSCGSQSCEGGRVTGESWWVPVVGYG